MKPISTMDSVLAVVGITYGIIVFLSAFLSTRFTEAFRIDLFFMRNPTPATKKLNIFFGLLILGSSLYSFLSHYR